MSTLAENYLRKIADVSRRTRAASNVADFQKLDTELRQIIDAISDDIATVSELGSTYGTTPKPPRKGKEWLENLFEPVIETYVAPTNFDYGVKGQIEVTHAEEVLEQGSFQKRQYKDVQRRNPKMNRSIKGVAVKRVMQELEQAKDQAYDILFDVSETIERLKRRPNG